MIPVSATHLISIQFFNINLVTQQP